jgi:hypothetical protein
MLLAAGSEVIARAMGKRFPTQAYNCVHCRESGICIGQLARENPSLYPVSA